MKIKEVIVVEGKDDHIKVTQAVSADTIITNGSAINADTISQIKHAQIKRGVIIFTDPDYPGERIRHIINQSVPGCKHAFLSPDQARSKHSKHKSLGIEHATTADIQAALARVHTWIDKEQHMITREDLLHHQLIGFPDSQMKRKRLGELLNIGHTNGKQLMKRLNMFQITPKQFEQAMAQVDQEVKNNHA